VTGEWCLVGRARVALKQGKPNGRTFLTAGNALSLEVPQCAQIDQILTVCGITNRFFHQSTVDAPEAPQRAKVLLMS
jgi:hypothetical protein